MRCGTAGLIWTQRFSSLGPEQIQWQDISALNVKPFVMNGNEEDRRCWYKDVALLCHNEVPCASSKAYDLGLRTA